MPGYADPGFDTLSLHAGAQPDPATGARATPIHLTTSFVFESSDHAASLFNLERPGHVYSRISNPTNAVLEQRVSALEGGVGSIATASGQAALHLAIATQMGAGSHIVASTALYGGSQNLLHYTLSRFGIETTFVKPGDIDGWRAAVRPNTKLFFGETVYKVLPLTRRMSLTFMPISPGEFRLSMICPPHGLMGQLGACWPAMTKTPPPAPRSARATPCAAHGRRPQ